MIAVVIPFPTRPNGVVYTTLVAEDAGPWGVAHDNRKGDEVAFWGGFDRLDAAERFAAAKAVELRAEYRQ